MIDGVVGSALGRHGAGSARPRRRMREAAEEERFEQAARYRNRVRIQQVAERQAADRRPVGDFDVLGLASSGTTVSWSWGSSAGA